MYYAGDKSRDTAIVEAFLEICDLLDKIDRSQLVESLEKLEDGKTPLSEDNFSIESIKLLSVLLKLYDKGYQQSIKEVQKLR